MSDIVFISSLPTETNNHDGYYRRVQNVEGVFSDQPRTHLDIRFWKNHRKRTYTTPEGMKVYHLNALLHIRLISRIIHKSRFVYIHSIAKIPGILLPVTRHASRVTFILDLHGVMIAELRLAGHSLRAAFYSRIERFCFKNFGVMVYVTEAMRSHYREKYPGFRGKEVVYYNITTSEPTRPDYLAKEAESLRSTLGIKPTETVILYSGNCQAWQNIDEMLQCIRDLGDRPFRFLILSGQQKRFREKLRHFNLPSDKIILTTVSAQDLPVYYEIAHYGMIIRNDILVNRVANPTKLAEYLQAGIIPVVKLAAIGDYLDFGYEYLDYNKLAENLHPRKSDKNREIYKEVSERYGSGPLRELLLHLDGE